MRIMQDMDELSLMPQVDVALLAASHDVPIQLFHAQVAAHGLRVEVVVDQIVPAHLPPAEVQVPTSHELLPPIGQLALVGSDGREVSHYAQS